MMVSDHGYPCGAQVCHILIGFCFNELPHFVDKKNVQKGDLQIKMMSPQQAWSWGVLWLLGSFLLQFPTGVESELTDVCKGQLKGLRKKQLQN